VTTATPLPVPPTFEESVASFRALVDGGRQDGQLDGDAAEELHERVDEVVEAVQVGNRGAVNQAFRDLRRSIDNLADGDDDDGASSELVADLRAAYDAMQAAT
jgi:hypothetical protein